MAIKSPTRLVPLLIGCLVPHAKLAGLHGGWEAWLLPRFACGSRRLLLAGIAGQSLNPCIGSHSRPRSDCIYNWP